MTVRTIVEYPDKRLREKSTPVEDLESDEFKQLVEDLKDTLTARRAHGLAAIQIGEPKRVFIISNEVGEPQIFVNPRITEVEGSMKWREGCLSFPGVEESVDRHEEVTIEAMDENGREFCVYMDQLEAVAVQHEYDHLDGVLFIDKMSRLKKRFLLKKLKKRKRKLTKEFHRR